MGQIFMKSLIGSSPTLQARVDYLEDYYQPMLNSATIAVDGINWTMTFDQSVEVGSGGADNWTVDMTSGGTVKLTYIGSGITDSDLVYSGDVIIDGGDTAATDLQYTQPGDGIKGLSDIEYISENKSGSFITNNSEVNLWDGQGAIPEPTGIFTYTTEGTNCGITLITQGAPTVTWDFGDGQSQSGNVYTPTLTLTGSERMTHTVTVDPPSGVTRINKNSVSLIGMRSLGNIPEVNYLYFYPWTTGEWCELSGCSKMTQWHFASNNVPFTEENFEEMMVSQAAGFADISNSSISGTFYQPSKASETAAAVAARAIIAAKGISGV